MVQLIVVRSQIKNHAQGLNISGDFTKVLSNKVIEMIGKAAERAKANKRRTLMAQDV